MKYYLLFFIGCLIFPQVWGQKYKVKIPYENVRNKMIIRVTVEGIEGKYIFDTGAPMAITYPRSEKCGKKEFIDQEIKDAHGNTAVYQMTRMESVRIGEINFQQIPVVVLEKGNPLECFGVDGVIGSSLFFSSVVRIDERNKKLILASDTEGMRLSPRNGLEMEMNRQNIPYIVISLGNGYDEKVMFDSGSPELYEMNGPTYRALASREAVKTLDRGFGALGMGIGGMEKRSWKYRVEIADFRIGTGKFKNVFTETMEGPGSRIGAELLKYGVVTLDFPNRRFYFEPFVSDPVERAERNWNADVIVAGDHLEIGCVWEGMKGKLEVGERVTAINGKVIDTLEPCEALVSPTIRLEGDEAVIRVRNNAGIEKTVTIRKE